MLSRDKIINFLFKFWPVLTIFIIWFIFASPYFFNGKVPYPSTYLVNHYHPWSLYQEFWGPVKNGAMPDVIDQIYPWKKFTIETWKSGQIPLWNPNNFSGNPNLANFQSAVFSPFNILFFVFPFVDAMSLLILAQPLLAGMFMYLFVRSLNISKKGSFISSISFMFCGFITVWMVYGTLGYAILFLPLALYGIEKYLITKKASYLFILFLTIPFSFFSGHFQISLYFLSFICFYVFYIFLTNRKISQIIPLIIPIFFGLLISLLQIIPSIGLYREAVRSSLFEIGEVIPWLYLPTFIAPDFFGNPVTRNDWFGHYAEWNAYIGFLPFLLALYSLFNIKQSKIFFLFLTSILSILLAFGSPLFVFLVNLHLPVVSTSAASRVIILFSFSFAVLSGFGFDFLIKDFKNNKRKNISLIMIIFTFIFLILWGVIAFKLFIPLDKISISKSNLIFPTVIFISSLIILLTIIKRNKFYTISLYLFIFIVIFDMFRFAQKWMPSDPKAFVFPNIQVISAMKQNVGHGRVFGNLGAQVSSYYNIPSIEGYDPIYISRYGEFIRSGVAGEYLQPERSIVKAYQDEKYINRIIDFLGANIIFHPVADTNQSWAYPVWKDPQRFELIYQDSSSQLFRNKNAMERVRLFYAYEVINNKKDIIKKFYSDEFDYKNKLILEEKPQIKSSGENLETFKKSAEIILYSPNKIIIKVSTERPGLLFLSDNFYSNWEAKVNNVKTKIYRADYAFRAVIVPKGDSLVEFNYNYF